jgi:hypothetical protein
MWIVAQLVARRWLWLRWDASDAVVDKSRKIVDK